jgi:hypothetical protein
MDLFIIRMIELDKKERNINIKDREINLIDYIKKLLN